MSRTLPTPVLGDVFTDTDRATTPRTLSTVTFRSSSRPSRVRTTGGNIDAHVVDLPGSPRQHQETSPSTGATIRLHYAVGHPSSARRQPSRSKGRASDRLEVSDGPGMGAVRGCRNPRAVVE